MAHIAPDKRHEKFQDSNALIQVSRQLQAAHAADLAATARDGASHPMGAPSRHSREVGGVLPSKRHKLQHVTQESAVIGASEGKHVSRTNMGSIPAVAAHQQVSDADQHTTMVDKDRDSRQPSVLLKPREIFVHITHWTEAGNFT
ncbi:MAG: hypothetical protein FRX49_06591 [Trebouxia sp. A1-2]|nr:MAG: hypothetical protein FRX49_06591 [Trebouxia sp. A1-2]